MSTNEILREEILSANVRSHQAEAQVYDIRHGELFNHYAQATYKRVIKTGLVNLLEFTKFETMQEIYALDCACGTGNISEKFLSAGCSLVGVDISPEMLAIMDAKLETAYRGRYTLVNQDVDSFLKSAPPRSFHIIAFCAALHHLHDYIGTFFKVIRVLKRPGLVLILHEPLPPDQTHASKVSEVIRKIDRLVWKYAGKIRRRKALNKPVSESDADLTDFHSRRGGITPQSLLEIVLQSGGEILEHLQKSENMRHWWSAWLDNSLELRKDAFHIVAIFK